MNVFSKNIKVKATDPLDNRLNCALGCMKQCLQS